MKIFKKIANKIIFALTKKPEHYVHIDKPRTLQDYRQVQYNKWCKAHNVYNGSYLPENPDTLTRKGKGWVEMQGKPDGTVRNFQRKSTGQRVRFDDKSNDKNGKTINKHYHWENGNTKEERKVNAKQKKHYLDRYGNTCARGSIESHLAPLDRKFRSKR